MAAAPPPRRGPPVPAGPGGDNFRQPAILARLTNPPLGAAPTALRFVGPTMAAQLAAGGIHTLRDLRDELAARTMAQNRVFLGALLENPHWNMAGGIFRCVGKRNNPRRPGFRYRVNRVAKFSWNSILVYMATRMPPAMQWRRVRVRGPALLGARRGARRPRYRWENRLPPLMHGPPRTALQAYPDVCA